MLKKSRNDAPDADASVRSKARLGSAGGGAWVVVTGSHLFRMDFNGGGRPTVGGGASDAGATMPDAAVVSRMVALLWGRDAGAVASYGKPPVVIKGDCSAPSRGELGRRTEA